MYFRNYKIAELNVRMHTDSDIVIRQGEPYLFDFEGEPDITINLSDDFITARNEEAPLLTRSECDYLYTGSFFYRKLIGFNGMLLHSSSLAYKNKAYLFSAPSGTGKSTHVSIWQQELGDRVTIINDDKPAIRLLDGVFYVYGTPWSGKTDKNSNIKVPLGGIVFLERSTENFSEPMDTAEAVKNLLWQTNRPRRKENMDKLLNTISQMFGRVPIYRMGCDMSREAFEMSFKTLTGEDPSDL